MISCQWMNDHQKQWNLALFHLSPFIILETLYKEKGIIFNRLFISLTYPKTYLLRRDSWKNTDHQFFKSSILLHTFSYISRVKWDETKIFWINFLSFYFQKRTISEFSKCHNAANNIFYFFFKNISRKKINTAPHSKSSGVLKQKKMQKSVAESVRHVNSKSVSASCALKRAQSYATPFK